MNCHSLLLAALGAAALLPGPGRSVRMTVDSELAGHTQSVVVSGGGGTLRLTSGNGRAMRDSLWATTPFTMTADLARGPVEIRNQSSHARLQVTIPLVADGQIVALGVAMSVTEFEGEILIQGIPRP